MHDRRGHRVGPHGEATDRIDVVRAKPGLFQHVEHDVADQRGGLVLQRGAAHVDVEVGFEAGREGHLALDDGEFSDELGQAGLLGIVGLHTP